MEGFLQKQHNSFLPSFCLVPTSKVLFAVPKQTILGFHKKKTFISIKLSQKQLIAMYIL